MRAFNPVTFALLALLCAADLGAQSGKQVTLASLVAPASKPVSLGTAPPPASLPARVIKASLSYLGVPYVRGGDSRQGLDCSGLIYRVFCDTAGLDLPRGVEGLYRAAGPAAYPLHIGDLLFFDTSEQAPRGVPTHVGVYIGRGRMVHAASEGSRIGVIVSSLSDPYYTDRFLGARRVIRWPDPVLPLTLSDEHAALEKVEPFPSHEELTIRVFNDMSGGGPVSLSLLKDGAEVLSRWIVPGAKKPAEVAVTTEVGRWTVRVSKIFKGRQLQDLTFTVVE